MVRTSGSTYAAVTIALMVAFPLAFLADPKQPNIAAMVVTEIFVIGSIVLAHLRCSSPVLSYWRGLCIVGGAWRTGIMQLSVIVATPILFLTHLIAVFISIIGIAFGKHWTQRAYIHLCHNLCRRNFDAQQAIDGLTPPPQRS